MHIYTIVVIDYIQWSGIQYVHVYSDNTIMARPLTFFFPFLIPLCFSSISLYSLGNPP